MFRRSGFWVCVFAAVRGYLVRSFGCGLVVLLSVLFAQSCLFDARLRDWFVIAFCGVYC